LLSNRPLRSRRKEREGNKFAASGLPQMVVAFFRQDLQDQHDGNSMPADQAKNSNPLKGVSLFPDRFTRSGKKLNKNLGVL